MLSSGPEGQAMMANWLRGGFEMDRNGAWRLNPQVADTLQRDVSAIMAQTGWQRAISRSAPDQISMGTTVGGTVGASAPSGDYASRGGRSEEPKSELQSLMRSSYSVVYCKKKNKTST